jgi:hypothetical protein
MTIHEKLKLIQEELKVPKNQFNKFGDFYYRSCEDIFEAVKIIAHKNNCTVTADDDVVQVGDRIYIKATAILTCCESREEIRRSAFAREPQTPRAKTDESQQTGGCSSYARKYALNGLFLIDDAKDADTTNTHAESVEFISNKQVGLFRDMLISLEKDEGKFCSYLGIDNIEKMPVSMLGKAQAALEAARAKKEAK